MKKTLLFALALAVIPVGVDAQAPDLEETRASAEQGNPIAQYNLGLMYANGRGVPRNDAEAERWYRLAAYQGHADAQYSLGTLYAGGEGVPEDHVLAYMWFNLAAAQGNEDAESGKAGIEEQMTREQIAEAQRLSREWLEAHPPGAN